MHWKSFVTGSYQNSTQLSSNLLGKPLEMQVKLITNKNPSFSKTKQNMLPFHVTAVF